MRFTPTPLKDSFLIDLEKREDERGFFARFYCSEEFKAHGLNPRFVQMNNSSSTQKGTLRGLHYQLAPKAENKLVRCIRGALYDVILDLRTDSPTFGKSFGAELSSDNRKMMFVPEGFAHGFITLEKDTEILYCVSEFYSKELERGIRWDDPKFHIQWPILPIVMSERDKNFPDFNPSIHLSA